MSNKYNTRFAIYFAAVLPAMRFFLLEFNFNKKFLSILETKHTIFHRERYWENLGKKTKMKIYFEENWFNYL